MGSIFLVDIQSFYASIEKSFRPELNHCPVVVSGDPERRSGIVLAACPIAKSYGIKNAQTLWQAQQKVPELVVIRPRMGLYLQASLSITQILERYSDQVEPYSIDEQFISIKGSEKKFGHPLEIAKSIQQAIQQEVHVYACIGMGPNKVLSKMACDQFAKKNTEGIFCLDHTNKRAFLWPLCIDRMFGVGKRMSTHLRQMGIRTIGHLAHFPLKSLTKRWGIQGQVLWMTANGLDDSPVTIRSFTEQKGIGHHMTLPRDYSTWEEIQVVLLELCEEVCCRVRRHRKLANTVTVNCRGNNFVVPTGFNRQLKMQDPTNETMGVFRQVQRLFLTFWDEQPIRSLGVQLSDLESDHRVQLCLFEPKNKNIELGYTVDRLKQRFGPTAVIRAASLTSSGQVFERARKIGGHYK